MICTFTLLYSGTRKHTLNSLWNLHLLTLNSNCTLHTHLLNNPHLPSPLHTPSVSHSTRFHPKASTKRSPRRHYISNFGEKCVLNIYFGKTAPCLWDCYENCYRIGLFYIGTTQTIKLVIRFYYQELQNVSYGFVRKYQIFSIQGSAWGPTNVIAYFTLVMFSCTKLL